MQCPSCGTDSIIQDICSECGSVFSFDTDDTANQNVEVTMNPAGEASDPRRKSSTLIEFPGVSRPNVPEWRKELSERVREVQERRAKETVREIAETETIPDDSSSIPPQLELLPQADLPPVNPLVAAALKRIERAHRPVRAKAAAAVAYAPSREDNECSAEVMVANAPNLNVDSNLEFFESEVAPEPKVDKGHALVVVPPPAVEQVKSPPASTPKRLIIDDDPVLNYLDSISRTVRVEEIDTRRASVVKRFMGGILDLLICAVLTAPVVLAIQMTGNDLQELRAITVISGSAVILAFIYFTLTTALTGRTVAMRLLSLRIIDKKTGLIPTGGQSAARAFLYLASLATAGLGILFALISRDGNTAHDQFTGTSVITT
jgi:uncharacterized RDD family membrane protein YckC